MPEIVVLHDPVPKARPRFAKGRVFTPRRSELAEHLIRQAWVGGGHGLTAAPVAIEIFVALRRPRAHYGTGRNAGEVRPSAPRWPAVKPDLDNYVKTALDALNGVAFGDDGHVVAIRARKRYALPDETPSWHIIVTPWTGER